MLRITIDLIPGGIEARKYPVAVMEIENISRDTGRRAHGKGRGDYQYRLSPSTGPYAYEETQHDWRDCCLNGTISGFLRLRRNFWALLRAVLERARQQRPEWFEMEMEPARPKTLMEVFAEEEREEKERKG